MTKENLIEELSSLSESSLLSVEALRIWLNAVNTDLAYLNLIPEGSILQIINGIVDVTEFEELTVDNVYKKYIDPSGDDTELVVPGITSLREYAFQMDDFLTAVSFPDLLSVAKNAFANTGCIERVELNKCTRLEQFAFHQCMSLTDIDLPVCSYVGNGAMQFCTSLESISLPSCEYIGSHAFWRDSSLESIYLPYQGIVTLENVDAFDDISNDYSVYVPFIWLFDYQTAQNWSQITEHIKPITNNLGTGTVIYNGTIVDEQYHEFTCIVISGSELENEADAITVTMPNGVNRVISTTAIYIGNYASVDDIDKSFSAIVEHQSWIKLNFSDTNFIPGQTYTFIKGGYIVKGGV